jgi:excalibur calcium-binding domain-containing protein
MTKMLQSTKLRVALLVVAASMLAVAITASSATAFVDKDCSDFPTQHKAQKYFKKHGGPRHDPSGLDRDHDGIACEDLP